MSLFDEQGVLLQDQLPEALGDEFYNDPETKQQPTKVFENVKDDKTLLKNYLNAQRTISKGEAAFAEKTKGMVKVPDDKSTPEEVAAYRKTMDIPDKPEDYQLPLPEGITDKGEKFKFETLAAVVSNAASKGNIPRKAALAAWKDVVAVQQKMDADLLAKEVAMIQADEKALKDKYKENYPAFIKDGDDVLAKLKTGGAIKELLMNYGILNHSSSREFLAEIAPLAIEGRSIGGPGGAEEPKKEGIFTYKYDENGKPIEE
jgi:hypothetical protein